MISKDSDFLNNRLKQLKASVLSGRGSEYNGQVSTPQNISSSHFRTNYLGEYDSNSNSNVQRSNSKQKYGITYTPLKQVSTNIQVLPNSSSKVMKIGALDLGGYESNKLAKDEPSIIERSINGGIENRRPLSQQPLETGKSRFNNVTIQSGNTTYIYPSPLAEDFKPTRTIYAVNGLSQNVNPNTQSHRTLDLNPQEDRRRTVDKIINSSNVHISQLASGRNLTINSERVHDDYGFRNTNTIVHPRDNTRAMTPRDNQDVGSEVLKSLNQSSFLLRHEEQILSDLTNKLNNEIDKNTRLHDDILHFRHSYEMEKQKIADLDNQLRSELQHLQDKDKEGLDRIDRLEDQLNDLTISERDVESKGIKVKGELDSTRKEAEILRNEIKRLADITSDKILDLENNINAITRMKELEKENFEMERDKVTNSGDFVIEQMKVHFNERTIRAEDQMRSINSQREKLKNELRSIGDELRIFNQNADQRINNELSIVIQEETERHNKEMREIESKIRAEEDEIARINRRNQEMLVQLQNTEREGKSRLLTSKNENTKYKEELSHLEAAFNKLLIQISNEGKDVDRRRESLESQRHELEDVKDKTANIEDGYADEMEQLVSNCDSVSKELEDSYNGLLDQEKKLIRQIKEQNEMIFEMQKRHAEAIEGIQMNINQTLNSQFKKLGSSRKGGFE